jgi:hypothetical protein
VLRIGLRKLRTIKEIVPCLDGSSRHIAIDHVTIRLLFRQHLMWLSVEELRVVEYLLLGRWLQTIQKVWGRRFRIVEVRVAEHLLHPLDWRLVTLDHFLLAIVYKLVPAGEGHVQTPHRARTHKDSVAEQSTWGVNSYWLSPKDLRPSYSREVTCGIFFKGDCSARSL